MENGELMWGEDGPNDEGVEGRGLGNLGRGRGLEVLLLDFAGDGVLVTEDEVDLGGRAASVGAEHDGVGGLVRKLLGLDALRATRSALARPRFGPPPPTTFKEE